MTWNWTFYNGSIYYIWYLHILFFLTALGKKLQPNRHVIEHNCNSSTVRTYYTYHLQHPIWWQQSKMDLQAKQMLAYSAPAGNLHQWGLQRCHHYWWLLYKSWCLHAPQIEPEDDEKKKKLETDIKISEYKWNLCSWIFLNSMSHLPTQIELEDSKKKTSMNRINF